MSKYLDSIDLDRQGRSIKSQTNFLLQPGNMTGRCLGVCLDSCRWDSQTTVLYEMSLDKMLNFIGSWKEQNDDNYPSLFGQVEWEKRFNKPCLPQKLPLKNHSICPRFNSVIFCPRFNEEHAGAPVIIDRGGRLRCGHQTTKWLKPSYIEWYR
ncbi:MAG: hypothetical protein CEN88_298, partial [Candidatus Berkelbacteria bacterium Licking1014_2]